MGDIADMMLEGILCECCGAFIDGDSDGVPRRCGDCTRYDQQEARSHTSKKPPAQKTSCPTCNRRVKLAGLADHQRDAHGVKGTT